MLLQGLAEHRLQTRRQNSCSQYFPGLFLRVHIPQRIESSSNTFITKGAWSVRSQESEGTLEIQKSDRRKLLTIVRHFQYLVLYMGVRKLLTPSIILPALKDVSCPEHEVLTAELRSRVAPQVFDPQKFLQRRRQIPVHPQTPEDFIPQMDFRPQDVV